MLSSQLVLICLGLFVINIRNAKAITEAEKSSLYSDFLESVLQCTTKFDIGGDLNKLLQATDNLDGVNPCLIACILKKNKLIDSKGLYDTEASKEMIEKFISSEEGVKKAEAVTEECSAVNEKEVSDGEKGCERAKLLAECFIPHRKLFLPN